MKRRDKIEAQAVFRIAAALGGFEFHGHLHAQGVILDAPDTIRQEFIYTDLVDGQPVKMKYTTRVEVSTTVSQLDPNESEI